LKLYKSEFKENPELCPICGSECVPLRYLGFDKARIANEFWIKEFEEPLLTRMDFQFGQKRKNGIAEAIPLIVVGVITDGEFEKEIAEKTVFA
jgi:hypothetical protein